jgi:hypothetical protein
MGVYGVEPESEEGEGDISERAHYAATGAAGLVLGPLRRWPERIGYAAAIWSLIYGALGLYWALGGAGFPFGSENDTGAALSILGGVRAGFGAPVIAALVMAGAVVAMARTRQGGGVLRALLLAVATEEWTARFLEYVGSEPSGELRVHLAQVAGMEGRVRWLGDLATMLPPGGTRT